MLALPDTHPPTFMLYPQVLTPGTDRSWSRSTVAVTRPVCWIVQMEGITVNCSWLVLIIVILRFVLKGVSYNPLDVMNCLMTRRGYKVEGDPQQRTLPNIHNKDDK